MLNNRNCLEEGGHSGTGRYLFNNKYHCLFVFIACLRNMSAGIISHVNDIWCATENILDWGINIWNCTLDLGLINKAIKSLLWKLRKVPSVTWKSLITQRYSMSNTKPIIYRTPSNSYEYCIAGCCQPKEHWSVRHTSIRMAPPYELFSFKLSHSWRANRTTLPNVYLTVEWYQPTDIQEVIIKKHTQI